MNSSKISVIIPIYNAKAYLDNCISSVLAQDYHSYELILVDDGSFDGSGKMCDEYALKASKIKVIHQANQGVTRARFNGVFNAKGEYIFFLDADDTIAPETLRIMENLMQPDIDIVVSNCRKNDILNRDEFALLLFQHELITVWGKLYRRCLFDDFVFNTQRYFACGEDFLMQLKLLKNLKGKVLRTNLNLYHYRDTPGSVTNTFVATMEYELAMLQEVDLAVKALPNNINIEHGHLNFKFIYLSGMIGLKYPLDFKAPWIIHIIHQSKSYPLTLKQKVTLLAVKYPAFRNVFIAEKKLRKLARQIIRHKR